MGIAGKRTVIMRIYDYLDTLTEPVALIGRTSGTVVFVNAAMSDYLKREVRGERLRNIPELKQLWDKGVSAFSERVELVEYHAGGFKECVVALRVLNGRSFTGGSALDSLLLSLATERDPAQLLNKVAELFAARYGAGRVCVNMDSTERQPDGSFIFNELTCAEGTGERVMGRPAPELISLLETRRDVEEGGWALPAVIVDGPKLTEADPTLSSFLKSHHLRTFVYCPLRATHSISACLCFANLTEEELTELLPELKALSILVSLTLRIRTLEVDRASQALRDPLTQTYNRNALKRYLHDFVPELSVGVILCDVVKFKDINRRHGSMYGDEILKNVGRTLTTFCRGFEIFRIGSDEFLCIKIAPEKAGFEQLVLRLRALFRSQSYQVAVGSAYEEEVMELSSVIALSESSLDSERRTFVHTPFKTNEKLREAYLAAPAGQGQDNWDEKTKALRCADPFYTYLNSNYYDALSVIKTLSSQSQPLYLCFGDLLTNHYYISDSLRDTFGFKDNIIYDFPAEWEKRLVNAGSRHIEGQDVSGFTAVRDMESRRNLVRDVRGEEIWLNCFSSITRDPKSGEPIFFTGFGLRLDDSYMVDPVMNLPGEFAAQADLDRLIRDEKKAKVFSLILNQMGEIYETIGRDATQRLLSEIARRTVSELSRYASFYHVSRRSLIAIERNTAINNAEEFAQSWRHIVDTCYETVGFVTKHASSIALLRCPEDIQSASDALEKFSYFETIAKQDPAKFVLLNENHLYEQRYQAKLLLELTAGVENNFAGYSTVIQPIVAARTGKISGGEILLRFFSDNKMQSPGQFIPALERSELIIEVGRYVFESAAKFVRRARQSFADFYISFNVSYVQVRDDPGFIDYMREVLRRYELPGDAFVLELTETNFDAYPEKLADFLERCHELGMRFALDDFGNGYSSLNLLLKYPVNVVKLDRSLTVRLSTSKDILSFMKSVIYACHKFGKQVVIECVETEDDLKAIRKTSADFIQGYYFYRPLSHREVYARIVDEHGLSDEVSEAG